MIACKASASTRLDLDTTLPMPARAFRALLLASASLAAWIAAAEAVEVNGHSLLARSVILLLLDDAGLSDSARLELLSGLAGSAGSRGVTGAFMACRPISS